MYNRSTLIKQLQDYHPYDNLESSFIAKFLELLQKENCYTRQNLEAHITASAWITDPERNSVLLLHHAKLNRWLQPGGHSDGNENLEEVVHKEVSEETGISDCKFIQSTLFDIDIHTIPVYKNIPEHDHYDVRFLMEAPAGSKILKNSESNEVKWVRLENIPSEISMLRMKSKLSEL